MPEIPEANRSNFIDLSYISKTYETVRGPYTVLEDFNLQIAQGEFVSLIGHSGCGKSTVLMIAAGLVKADRGGFILNNREVTQPGPDRGVVFQSPSLLPWMTALENVLLGVRQVYPHATEKQRKDIAKYYLNRVGLGSSISQRASGLSNGMKQRVGIARAFALKPKLLLLDEPFGMLDSLTRAELQEVLLDIWQSEKITAILVTHDVDEALFLSDRVVMMTNGPRARVGDILPVNFERPRKRRPVLEHPDYYPNRGHLIDFLTGRARKPLAAEKSDENEKISESLTPVSELNLCKIKPVLYSTPPSPSLLKRGLGGIPYAQ